ncbi:MAG: hypothetical protein AB7O21_17625 [Gammaproteobacteria bacterium]
MKPVRHLSALACIAMWSGTAGAAITHFGEETFTILEQQGGERFGWDSGDTLIATFDVSGRVGSITGGKNTVVIPEVKLLGNTIVPEVRRDTRSGFRFTGEIEGYAGAVLSAGITLGGGTIAGAIGLGPTLEMPDQVRAGRFFTLRGGNVVNHTTSNFNLNLPSIDTGLDLLIGGEGQGTVEFGLFPFTGYSIGDFDFNLPDIRLPVISLDWDLNLPRLPTFDFLDLPDLIPESDKDTALFRKKLPPGNPLLSAGEAVLDNPVATAVSTTRVEDGAVIKTSKGDLGRIGLDIDGILSFATTGVSFTGLEASVAKVATVKYDTVDVKYGIELGYEIENRIDTWLEVTLNFLEVGTDNATPVLMRDGDGTSAISTWSGRWDQIPDLALLSDSDVDVDIDFTGLKRELGQKGALTLSDYMELRVLAASATTPVGGLFDLGPLLYKKFELAGEFASFEIYDTTVTLTDFGLTAGLWDDRLTIDAIELADAYLASPSAPIDQAASFRRLDDHTTLTTLADKTLIIGQAEPGASSIADVTPVEVVDPGAKRTVRVEIRDVFNSTFREFNITRVDDTTRIVSTGGLALPDGSVYRNDGARRFKLFSIENDGIIDNNGWLDFQALDDQLIITGDGIIHFGAKDENDRESSGSVKASLLVHGAGHTLDFGPRGFWTSNLTEQARAQSGLTGSNFGLVDPIDPGSLITSRTAHALDVTGSLQNFGTIRLRGAGLTLAPTNLSNESGGLLEVTRGLFRTANGFAGQSGGSLVIGTNTTLKNLGRLVAHDLGNAIIGAKNVHGATDGTRGTFEARDFAQVAFNPQSGDTTLHGALDFIAGESGVVVFQRRVALGNSADIRLITEPLGTLQLNGLFRNGLGGEIQVENRGLLDIVSGNVTFVPSPGGLTPDTTVIVPINLVNEGTVRIRAGAQLLFDVDIVDYADGGATFAGGTWELLGATQRFFNTTPVSLFNPGASVAMMTVNVSGVFGNADRFGDLVFDEAVDPDTGEVRVTDISSLDTTLRFNAANVTLSGAAKFDYFNTLSTNLGTLKLLNQHQFSTAGNFENRGGTTLIDSGAGLHVNGSLLVNGGQVIFGGGAELTIAGENRTLDDGTVERHDVEVAGGELRISQGTSLSSALVSRTRTDGLLLQGGRSWVIRDSVETAGDGNEIVTPGILELGVLTNNGIAGVVRNNAMVTLSGTHARFDALENFLLYQHGNLVISDGQVYETPNTYFRNANETTLTGAQFLMAEGEFRNDGILNIDSGSFLGVDFLNLVTGVVNVEGVVTASSSFVASPVNLLGGGLFNSETITMDANGEFIIDGGTLLTASLAGSLTVDTGVFAPGQSIGVANILGDYTQTPDGILDIEWDATGADLVDVGGVATLAGGVQLRFLNDFVPTLGASVEILTASAIFDAFSPEVIEATPRTGLAFALRQESNRVFLEVIAAPVPLPPAGVLLGSALFGASLLRAPHRRRGASD